LAVLFFDNRKSAAAWSRGWFDFVSYPLFAVEIHPFATKRLAKHCGFACYAISGGYSPASKPRSIKVNQAW
jgi:hypothetical protein